MSSGLQSIAAQLRFSNYLSLVMATAVSYDYVITFQKEIQYIWKRSWTFVSSMFLLVRYVGLVAALWKHFHTWSNFGTVLLLVYNGAFIIFLAAADAVMILRVYAMYNKSRIILGVLLGFCAATIVLYAVSVAFYNNPNTTLKMMTPHVFNMSFCNPTYTTSSKFGRYKLVPRLTLAALMFVLVVVRIGVDSFQMYKATKQWKISQYLTLLTREGALYFLVHLFNNIDFGDGTAANVVTMLITVLLYILSPRFVINVRELYMHKLLHGNGWNKGIDSGFGLPANQSSSAVVASLAQLPDLRVAGMTEGDVEMQGVGSETNLDVDGNATDAKQPRLSGSHGQGCE